jgi:hypothetical protein
MKEFEREFDLDSLDEHIGNDRSLIGALLERWVLPGEKQGDKLALRLAVRDGYLNLYANGQSVAKISASAGKPRIEVHWKYVEGVRKGETAGASPRTYLQFSHAFRSAEASAMIDRWVETAATYAGDEKRFVEHLVAANANVIDLEMGLPGDPHFRSSRPEREGKTGLFAPRMDLVVVNPDRSGNAIQFWEAKLATNGELRAGGIPHVIHQLDDYTRWISGRSDKVASAFYRAAAVLAALAARSGKAGKARSIWAAVADKPLSVRARPALIIADYDPGGTSDRQARRAKSFGPHRDKLRSLSCHVRQISGAGCDQAVLCAIEPEAAA